MNGFICFAAKDSTNIEKQAICQVYCATVYCATSYWIGRICEFWYFPNFHLGQGGLYPNPKSEFRMFKLVNPM